jgi:hypothetical protein
MARARACALGFFFMGAPGTREGPYDMARRLGTVGYHVVP